MYDLDLATRTLNRTIDRLGECALFTLLPPAGGALSTVACMCRHDGTPGKLIFDDFIFGKRAIAFLW